MDLDWDIPLGGATGKVQIPERAGRREQTSAERRGRHTLPLPSGAPATAKRRGRRTAAASTLQTKLTKGTEFSTHHPLTAVPQLRTPNL